MAKKNKQTAKSLRQGQTVHYVDHNIRNGPFHFATVMVIFLYSHKEPIPPSECVIEKKASFTFTGYFKFIFCGGVFCLLFKK